MKWQKLKLVTDPAGQSGDLFGRMVAFDGITNRFLIGAIGYAQFSGKAIFGKID